MDTKCRHLRYYNPWNSWLGRTENKTDSLTLQLQVYNQITFHSCRIISHQVVVITEDLLRANTVYVLLCIPCWWNEIRVGELSMRDALSKERFGTRKDTSPRPSWDLVCRPRTWPDIHRGRRITRCMDPLKPEYLDYVSIQTFGSNYLVWRLS